MRIQNAPVLMFNRVLNMLLLAPISQSYSHEMNYWNIKSHESWRETYSERFLDVFDLVYFFNQPDFTFCSWQKGIMFECHLVFGMPQGLRKHLRLTYCKISSNFQRKTRRLFAENLRMVTYSNLKTLKIIEKGVNH